jgi:T3SS negative regulator,GrlR
MANRDGFYAVQFQTPMGMGTGIVFLQGGILRGGDSMIYYTGDYQLNGDSFSGEVVTNAHARPPGMASVFGRDNVHITLKGNFSGDDATLTGTAKEAPGVQFSARLKKIGP